jgi:hypothetical protein
MSARVTDFTPEAFRRTLDRRQPPAGDERTVSVIDDMADGILALDFALTFAGFGGEARQLTLSVVGLLGGAGGTLEAFDGELAAHLNYSDRTIRRWRSAHLKEAKRRRFSLLEITEGEYNSEHRRYGKTSYRFTAPHYVDAVVSAARASDFYQSDRRAAVERAAEEHYSDIPDSPPRRRQRKPRRAPTVKVEQAFVNAVRNVEKGRHALQDLPEDSRAALLESKQGKELRQMLLKLQADIGGVLENFPQPPEMQGVDEGTGHFVRCPPIEPSAADVAVWERLEWRSAGAPNVVTRELILRPPSSDENMEAEAIRAEGCGEV